MIVFGGNQVCAGLSASKEIQVATVYRLRVSMVGFSGLYRILDVASDATFANLHDAIFCAFDRDDPHLYSFYMTGIDTKDVRRIRQAREIPAQEAGVGDGLLGFTGSGSSAKKARIGDVELDEGDVVHYLFDYGDEWWHRIRVEAITESDARKKKGIVLVKSVGASPAQYPEFD